MLGNLKVERQSCFHRILENFFVEHRQGARQTAHHRVDVGVGVITESGRGGGEDLAVGPQLDVGLQADHGFPVGQCCRRACHVLHLYRWWSRSYGPNGRFTVIS